MTLFQRNLFACFMGFAVLSLFNINHAFADEKISFAKKLSIAVSEKNQSFKFSI